MSDDTADILSTLNKHTNLKTAEL